MYVYMVIDLSVDIHVFVYGFTYLFISLCIIDSRCTLFLSIHFSLRICDTYVDLYVTLLYV